MIIVILPVTIRNYMIEPEVVLISSQGGANFFIGNNQHSDGQTVSFPFGQTPLNRYEDHIWSASKFIAESRTRHKLTSAEISDYWFDQGKNFVTEKPGEAIGLLLKKSYLLFCGEELFNNSNPIMPREYSQLYALSIWQKGINFPFGIIAPLFLIGSVLLLRQQQKRSLLLLFVFSQIATISLFFVSSRFRQPLLPVMIVVAVYAGHELFLWLKSKNWHRSQYMGQYWYYWWQCSTHRLRFRAVRIVRCIGHCLAARWLRRNDTRKQSSSCGSRLRSPMTMQRRFSCWAVSMSKAGNLIRRLAVLHRAEELAPDAIQTKSVLARIYYDRQDFRRALSYFEAVLNSGMTMEKFNFWAARSAFEIGETRNGTALHRGCSQRKPGRQRSAQVGEPNQEFWFY